MRMIGILPIGSFFVLSFLLVTQDVGLAGPPVTIPSLPPIFPNSRIIMVLDNGPDAPTLSIDRYTEVTWINDTSGGIRIGFGKGPECREVSAAAFPALGIRMQANKCFVTSLIPPKGTLRFRFEEFGDYKYKVLYLGKSEVGHGELKVL